jgi:hypothetical protein
MTSEQPGQRVLRTGREEKKKIAKRKKMDKLFYNR